MVSDQPGRLHVVAVTDSGNILHNIYYPNSTWRGWQQLPGTRGWFDVCEPASCHVLRGSPAVSSWAPGRLDVFVNTWRSDGGSALKHLWMNNGQWATSKFEVLGTGWMQGSPAAVSKGVGRIDVFVLGDGNELVQKSFASGSWSGWVDRGGEMTSSPVATTSTGADLHVFVRGTDSHLWQ